MILSLTGNNRPLPEWLMAMFIPAVSVVLLLATGCAAMPDHGHDAMPDASGSATVANAEQPVQATPVLDLGAMLNLESLIPRLADKRVVFVGETHDRYDHHLNQLEIIRRLHAIHHRLAIGMEAFQQPFQAVLDDYIAGNLTERELLRDSEYYERWRFDFRLYAPILRYAREHHLPVVALSLPAELTRKVGRAGLDALGEDERAQLPAEIDRSDADYARRLREVFDRHPQEGHSFDNFLDVQLLWDEGMAEQAADYLMAHPDEHMVVLAGIGHLAWGSGIPRRLARRLPADSAIVLNDWVGDLQPDQADFVLLTEARKLPPAGRFGALLETRDDALEVAHCIPGSPCARAGLRKGDRFLAIDDEPVTSMTDLRLATWDKHPGDTVTLRISRRHWFMAPQELSYSIELQ